MVEKLWLMCCDECACMYAAPNSVTLNKVCPLSSRLPKRYRQTSACSVDNKRCTPFARFLNLHQKKGGGGNLIICKHLQSTTYCSAKAQLQRRDTHHRHLWRDDVRRAPVTCPSLFFVIVPCALVVKRTPTFPATSSAVYRACQS